VTDREINEEVERLTKTLVKVKDEKRKLETELLLRDQKLSEIKRRLGILKMFDNTEEKT